MKTYFRIELIEGQTLVETLQVEQFGRAPFIGKFLRSSHPLTFRIAEIASTRVDKIEPYVDTFLCVSDPHHRAGATFEVRDRERGRSDAEKFAVLTSYREACTKELLCLHEKDERLLSRLSSKSTTQQSAAPEKRAA